MTQLSNNQTEQTSVAIYARVSTHNQDTDTQIADNKKWANDRKYKIVEIYQDVISGKAKMLPNQYRMMQDARNGRFKKLIVYNVDRLGRSIKDMINTFEELRKLGISIAIVCKNLEVSDNPEDVHGKVFFVILSLFADIEHTFIKERTESGRRTKHIRKIYAIGGKLLWGYYQRKKEGRDDKADRPIKTDQSIKGYYHDIIYQGIVTYRYSLDKVAEMLNESGIKTSRNKKWNRYNLAMLLSEKNRNTLTGKIIVGKNKYKLGQTKSGTSISNKIGEHPREKWIEIPIEDPIYTEEEFDKIREVINSNIKKGNDPMGDVGLIRQLNIRCGVCGDKFRIRLGDKRKKVPRRVYYSPSTHLMAISDRERRGLKVCTHLPSAVPADKVDKYIWNTFISRILLDDKMIDSLLNITSEEAKLKSLDKDIAEEEKWIKKINAQEKQLLEDHLAGQFNHTIVAQKLKELHVDRERRDGKVRKYRQEKIIVENSLETARKFKSEREELHNKIGTAKDKLESLPFEEKRAILSYLYGDTVFKFFPIDKVKAKSLKDSRLRKNYIWWVPQGKDAGIYMEFEGYVRRDKLLNLLEKLNNNNVALSKQHLCVFNKHHFPAKEVTEG